MSTGVSLEAEDDQYHTGESPAFPRSIYRDHSYLDDGSKRLLKEKCGVPERSFSTIDALIGNFLERIQQASFVPPDEAIHLLSGLREDYYVPEQHCSTLPLLTLTAAIRDQMKDTLLSFIGLLSPDDQKRIIETYRTSRKISASQEDPAAEPAGRITFLDPRDIDLLNSQNFIDPESSNIIRAFREENGEKDIAAANGALLNVARSIAARSLLSATSFRRNMGFLQRRRDTLCHHEKGKPDDPRYSTLNPQDVIPIVQTRLKAWIGSLIFLQGIDPSRYASVEASTAASAAEKA